MKLTKSKNAHEAFFYRDTDQGKLYKGKLLAEDNTGKIIEGLDKALKESLRRRILKKADRNNHKERKNEFENFIQNLVEGTITNLPNISSDSAKNFDGGKYFSPYGRKLVIEKEKENLEQLLKRYYEKNEDIHKDLEVWAEKLKERIKHKKERLEKSVKNNKIPSPMSPQIDDIKKNSRAQWLFSFIKDEGKFDTYKNWYGLEGLCKKLGQQYFDRRDKSPKGLPKFAGYVYKNIKQYNGKLYLEKIKTMSSEDAQGYVFYLNEVQAYFRHYFAGKEMPKRLDTDKKVMFLIGADKCKGDKDKDVIYPYMWIKAHITNKINALLIQNGKLEHYEIKNPCSNDLINIQVEEAFKKQLFLSLAWAITRLNYFFDYGSNNAKNLADKKNQGDILQEFTKDKNLKDKNLWDEYQEVGINENGAKYIKRFLTELKKSENHQKEFQQKVCTTFPLLMTTSCSDEDMHKLLDVIDATRCSVSYLRNNIFHHKKDYLYELTKAQGVTEIINSNYSETVKQVFKKDILSVNKCFKEKIRSSLIAEYYSRDILEKIFVNMEFHIYAPKYAGMPSFRKIYERGANICSAGKSKSRELSWFRAKPIGTKDDLKKWQAYKNLLQIIYEHGFLPAAYKDDSLITKYINETKKFSKESTSSKNPYCYRYNNMPRYNHTSLAVYMADLQRMQSAEESTKHDEPKSEGKKEENYYIDFIQDIFVRAFDHYLDDKFINIKSSFTDFNKETSDVENTLDLLFDEELPIISMKQDLSDEDELCLLFYPFLKMLERRELSNLQQQIVKYRCSLGNRQSLNKDSETEKSKTLEQLIALLIFTFPDHIYEEKIYGEMVKKHFSKFIDGDISNYPALYCTDTSGTSIQQRSMLALMRTGALALYSGMFTQKESQEKYIVTQKDYNDYKEWRGLGEERKDNLPLPIEEKQKKLAELHEKLCKEKEISREQAEDYKRTLREVNNYVWLRRKVTFETLYELHLVHVDILSRLASFAEDWERDMHFLLIGLNLLSEQRKTEFLTLSRGDIESIFEHSDNGGTVTQKFLEKFTGATNEKILTQLCWCNSETLCEGDLQKIIRPRNSFAHLNHMTQVKQKDHSQINYQKSIIELLSSASKLLNYDLKRKNSVTRILKEVLQKYHIKISLCKKAPKKDTKENIVLGYTYELQTINSDDIIHLKSTGKDGKSKPNHNIPVQARDKLFVELVKQLLEFSYSK